MGRQEESSSESSTVTWIQWYCSNRGNDFFCEVDEDFIQDQFNMCGLPEIVPNFRAARNRILDIDMDRSSGTGDGADEQDDELEKNAELLYGLVHARYILTNKGLLQMLDKYKKADFGCCPRELCKNHPLLPLGFCNEASRDTVKMFCINCEDVYQPRHQRHKQIDGAFFGNSFPQMLLMVYPTLRRNKEIETYKPTLYGFRIHPSVFH